MPPSTYQNRQLHDRHKTFSEAYLETGSAAKAAIKAGYSEHSASSQGSRLLQVREVQEMLGGLRVRRDIHAERTYLTLIDLADIAYDHAVKVNKSETAESGELEIAIDCAGRALGRLAKVEGLLATANIQNFFGSGSKAQFINASVRDEILKDSEAVDVVHRIISRSSNGDGDGSPDDDSGELGGNGQQGDVEALPSPPPSGP